MFRESVDYNFNSEGNGDMDLDKARKLLEESGMTGGIMEKIAKSPKLRKAFQLVAVVSGLLIGAEGFVSKNVSSQEVDNVKAGEIENEKQKELITEVFNKLSDLVKQLMSKKKLIRFRDTGLYSGKIGEYSVEYFDRNKDGKINPQTERMSVGWTDSSGVKYNIGTSFGVLNGVAVANDTIASGDFQKMTAWEFKSRTGIIVRRPDDAIMNVKFLKVEDIEKVVGDINNEMSDEQK